MKFTKSIFLSTTTLALLTFSNTAFAAGEVIGVNSAVKGNVTVQMSGQSAQQAAVRDSIRIGDEVNSAHSSSLQVLLKDQTTFTVGADCVLTIDKFVYNPATSANAMTASVAKGMFRFMSGNISKSNPNSVTIDTPVASMGVRGTMVEGLVGSDAIRYAIAQGLIDANTKVDRDGATLFILRGPGRGRSGKNRKGEISVTSGGQTVTVRRAGSMVFVPSRDASPLEVGFVSDTLLEVFSNTLRTKPVGSASYKPFALPKHIKKSLETPDLDIREIMFFNPVADMDWPHEDGQTGNTP